jgi:uncharacterized protein (DUF1015 family)
MPDVSPDPGLALQPFRAVRYDPARVRSLAAVTSPPYDVIDEDALARFLAEEPHNVVRLILPQDDYGEAAETLRDWLASGVLTVDAEPALYVYEEAAEGLVQRGLIGALGIRDETSTAVLPHEDVFAGRVRDRLALMSATEANLEPIFLLYEGGLDSAASRTVADTASSAPPLLEADTGDHVRHRLWAVTDPAVHAAVADDLRGRQALIADGHHRYATYQALRRRHDAPGPWDYGLAMLVDSTAYPPRLGAIHRVIPGLPLRTAVRAAESAFRVEPLDPELPDALDRLAARDDTAFLLGGKEGLFLLTAPDPATVENAMPETASERWRGLDTAVLHRLLIPRIWGIDEDETTVRIVHHDASKALAKAIRAGGTAVILNALKVPDVLAVAAQGEKVPRKSTSFGPKPRTGLVMRTFAAG